MRRVYIGGAFVTVTAFIAAWLAFFGNSSSNTSCPLPAYPSLACAGVPSGTTLTPYTGPVDIKVPGTVIDGKDVADCLTILAGGVIIKNSSIHCPNFLTIRIDAESFAGDPPIIQDSDISCTASGARGTAGAGSAVVFADFVLLRDNIFGCENGVSVGVNGVIQDSYIHDLFQDENSHSDGIQADGSHIENGVSVRGSKNVTILHNTIDAFGSDGQNGNSAVIFNHEPDRDENILIKDNLFIGGLYTVFCYAGVGLNFRLIDNHFSTLRGPKVGTFGPWTGCADESLSGNVYHETGLPVKPN